LVQWVGKTCRREKKNDEKMTIFSLFMKWRRKLKTRL
jgi:hypothetical protein